MMFLILQLAFWLLVAGLLGFGAGWFLQARRMGAKLSEQRERSRQHIQRLELGLADAQSDELEPYAKEQRAPVEASDNPESFLSGGDYQRPSVDDSAPAQAEASGLSTPQTVTLAPLSSTADIETKPEPVPETVPAVLAEPQVEPEHEPEHEHSAEDDWVADPQVPADSSLQQRIEGCEQDIMALRKELVNLEQRCAHDDRTIRSAVEEATKPAEMAGDMPPWAMAAPDGQPDDLKRIWGVGPKLENMLHDMGIYHFRQIAAFTASDVKSVSARLDQFSDRVERDDWISQAKKLMAQQ